MSLPRIGISANFLYPDATRNAYAKKTLIYNETELSNWVAQAPAIPYMVPQPSSVLSMQDIVNDLDAIIISGGADLCPKSYGETPLKPEWNGDYLRDQYEIALFNTAKDLKKPILGICRGHQLINVAMGGTLYQDIEMQVSSAIQHRDAEIYDNLGHDIVIEPNSILADIFPDQTSAAINSVHHQSIKNLGDGLSVQARSVKDGIIEAVFSTDPNTYIMGVQWHPEWIREHNQLNSSKILTHFLAAIS